MRRWAVAIALLGVGCTELLPGDVTRPCDGSRCGAADAAAGLDAGIDGGPDAGSAERGCGDGVVDPDEACDDGARADGDGCDAECALEDGFSCVIEDGRSVCSPICGDGMQVGDEVCDDGGTTACGACNADCTGPGEASTCGDGRVCADDEGCDQGASDMGDGDGCSTDCQVEIGWVCGGEPSACAMTCGNGRVDPMEACDDEGTEDGDGCSAACAVERGWTCEDLPGMPSVCETRCGDGAIAGAETCDDENETDGDGCSAGCAVETGWDCTGEPSGCRAVCGDGRVVGEEVCDDGNDVTEDACPYGTPSCTICEATCRGESTRTGPYCGDEVWQPAEEECDDGDGGPFFFGDGCDGSCTVDPGWTCSGSPSVCTGICGDGMQVGDEACDDGNTVTETECSYGTTSCDGCSADCASALTLTGGECGDGVVQSAFEACDDGNVRDCGLCDASCSAERPPPAPAFGSIEVVPGHELSDGEGVRIHDGFVTSELTFQRSASGPYDVYYETWMSGADVAAQLELAIGRVTSEILATASGAVVDLHHRRFGSRFDEPITETVSASGFRVHGMDGGHGDPCEDGTTCSDSLACESGDCSGGVCAPPP